MPPRCLTTVNPASPLTLANLLIIGRMCGTTRAKTGRNWNACGTSFGFLLTMQAACVDRSFYAWSHFRRQAAGIQIWSEMRCLYLRPLPLRERAALDVRQVRLGEGASSLDSNLETPSPNLVC